MIGLFLIVAGGALLYVVLTRGPAGMHQEAPWTEIGATLLGIALLVVGVLMNAGPG